MKAAGRLEITVDGEPWRPVTTLDESGPHDPCYVVRIADDGTATVAFGDGEHGSRPPEGSSIEATYQTGGGDASHAPRKGSLAALLDLIADMVDQISHDLDQIYADAFIETADGRMNLADVTDLRSVVAGHRVEFLVRLRRRRRPPKHPH